MDELDKYLEKMLKPYGFWISNDSYYARSLSFENDKLLIYAEEGEISILSNVTGQVYNKYTVDPHGSNQKTFYVNCKFSLADPDCFKKMIRIVIKTCNKDWYY